MAVSNYSTTASTNGTISGINIAELCAAGNLNNAIRQLMADIRTELTDAVLTLTAKATVAEIRTALDALEAKPATEAINALTPAADRMPYYTGAAAASLATLTAFARTLLDDADAATARATLGALAVTASSLTFPKGYVKLSNGLHILWGSRSFTGGGASTVVDYTTEMGVTITLTVGSMAVISGANTGDTDRNGPFTTATSTTGFTAFSRSTATVTGFWLAVGV